VPAFKLPKVTMTTDIAIFTIREDRLEILLIRRGHPPFQGKWALPGGLLEEDEDLDVCARRELEEETGVSGLALEQFHAFGAPGRDPRGRYVTVAYLTMVRPDRLSPKADDDAAAVGWFAVESLPPLAFDHAEIIAMARRRLRRRLEESALAFGYLPDAFTLDELRRLHEVVRGEPIEPRAFRTWAMTTDLVEDAGRASTGGRRPARLYRAIAREGPPPLSGS
jgi:8-oxo-dGTP diphosphatase